jgi:hypothetical protein
MLLTSAWVAPALTIPRRLFSYRLQAAYPRATRFSQASKSSIHIVKYMSQTQESNTIVKQLWSTTYGLTLEFQDVTELRDAT